MYKMQEQEVKSDPGRERTKMGMYGLRGSILMGLIECPEGHRTIISSISRSRGPRKKIFRCSRCKQSYPKWMWKVIKGTKGMRRKVDYGFIDCRKQVMTIRLNCIWCGKPTKRDKQEMRNMIDSFLKHKGANNTSFGVFCSWTCKKDFKEWIER